MAASFVINLGSSSNGNASSINVTCAAAVPVGDWVLVHASVRNRPGTITATDSKGNTYTDVSGGVSGSAVLIAIVATGKNLTTSDTITISNSAGMGGMCMDVEQFTGMPSTYTADGAVATGSGSSATPSVTNSNMTNAEDLVIGHISQGNSSFSVSVDDSDTDGGDSWHRLTAASGTSMRSALAYKFTTSAVTQTHNVTLQFTCAWEEQVFGGQGPATDNYVRPIISVSTAAVQRAATW